MNDYENKLLKCAYDNFNNNGTYEYQVVANNSEKLVKIISALSYLKDIGYISMLSGDLEQRTRTIVNNVQKSNDLIFKYKLTDAGISYVMSNF